MRIPLIPADAEFLARPLPDSVIKVCITYICELGRFILPPGDYDLCERVHTESNFLVAVEFCPNPEPAFSVSFARRAKRSLMTVDVLVGVTLRMFGLLRSVWIHYHPETPLMTLTKMLSHLRPVQQTWAKECIEQLHEAGTYGALSEDAVVFAELLLFLLAYDNFCVEEGYHIEFYADIIRTPEQHLASALQLMKDGLLDTFIRAK